MQQLHELFWHWQSAPHAHLGFEQTWHPVWPWHGAAQQATGSHLPGSHWQDGPHLQPYVHRGWERARHPRVEPVSSPGPRQAEVAEQGCPLPPLTSHWGRAGAGRGAAGRGKSNFCRSDSTTVFARSPPAPAPAPSPWLWVPTCQFSSYFIILLLVTITLLLVTSMRDYFYFTASVIVYYSLPPPPYAACVMPLRAHPLAAVCAAAPGGWAPGQGA